MSEYVVVAPSAGQVDLQQMTISDPGPNEIQVRSHATLVSPGTERAWILGLPNTPQVFPFEPGYCGAGVVEKVGSEVNNFKCGDRVACFLLGHRSVGNVEEKWAVRIPDSVSYEKAAFMPLGQVALQGVRKSCIELGEKVMVLGMGVIGQLALQFCRLNGALPAIGADRMDKRLQQALDCGAHEVVNTGKENWLESLCEKPQVVIESTGFPDAVSVAMEAVAQMGRVVMLGSTRGDSTINFYKDVHSKGINIIGAHAGRVPAVESRAGYWTWKDDANCFMKLLENKSINTDPLITDRINWRDAVQTYKKLLEWNMDTLGIVINWQ